MEDNLIKISYEKNLFELKFEPAFDLLINRCIQLIGLNKEEIESVELKYLQYAIRSQEDFDNNLNLFRNNEVKFSMNVKKKLNSSRINSQAGKDVLNINKIAVDKPGAKSKELLSKNSSHNYMKNIKSEFKIPIFMKQSSINIEEFKEIDDFSEIKGNYLRVDNQSINLNHLIRIKETASTFSLTHDSIGIESPTCKPENNEKLKVFDVIIGKVRCSCGKVIGNLFVCCSICKNYYRCLECWKQNAENHRMKEFRINDGVKIKKISKEIQKLGFTDLNQVSDAITKSNYNYSAAVRLLLHPLI